MGLFNSIARALAPTFDTRDPRGEAGMTDQRSNPVLQGDMARYASAIRGIESNLSPEAYGMIGAKTRRGDRALGAYQVMRDANLGKWSQDVFGRTVSQDEYLSSPAMQDEMFKAKFGGQMNTLSSPSYGTIPAGKTATRAAGEWYGGPNFNPAATDIHGRYDVTDYMRAFDNNLAKGLLPTQPLSVHPQMAVATNSVQPDPEIVKPPLGGILDGISRRYQAMSSDKQDLLGLLADSLAAPAQDQALPQYQARRGYDAPARSAAYWRNRWLKKFGPTSGLYAILAGGGDVSGLSDAEKSELALYRAA